MRGTGKKMRADEGKGNKYILRTIKQNGYQNIQITVRNNRVEKKKKEIMG